jgi:hypothetical protein
MSKTKENYSSMNGIVENHYQNGKIYKIVCNKTSLIYYGSSCEPTLARRLAKHVFDFRRWLKGNKHHTSHRLKFLNEEIIKLFSWNCSLVLPKMNYYEERGFMLKIMSV